MELTFSSGTAEQKKLWGEGLRLLRYLPLTGVPLSIDVSFLPPSEIGQTSFAETTWTYDSNASTTKVRNDAPGFGSADSALIAEAASWGLHFNPIQHFHETAVHELGHSIFAALSQDIRLSILALFGVHSDDPDVVSPPGSDWHDRPIEAVAETFKEAFLSARYRVFGNRTNLKLSYSHYPALRALWREGVEGISEEESGEPLGVQMANLPVVAALNSGPRWENPNVPTPPSGSILLPPWVEWGPAESIGYVFWFGINSPAYRAAVNSAGEPERTPREVAALHTTTNHTGAFGVRATHNEEWTTSNEPPGQIHVFAAADAAGNGYKLVATRTAAAVGEGPPGFAENEDLYSIRLERWVGGSLSAVLAEATNVMVYTVGGSFGISVVNGTVTAWSRPTTSGIMVAACSAIDYTFTSGFCGLGVKRNDSSINGSNPSLRAFRAGPLVPPTPGGSGGPIDVPVGLVKAGGGRSGRVPSRGRVRGART